MSSHSADEAAIRQSHQANIDALNRGDVKAWASSFASGADYFDSLGHLSKGREDIEQRFQGLLTGPLQGAKFEGEIENIRFLTPTVALIDLTADITPIQGLPRKLRSIAVLVKQDGQWLSTAGRSWVPATVPV